MIPTQYSVKIDAVIEAHDEDDALLKLYTHLRRKFHSEEAEPHVVEFIYECHALEGSERRD